ncbi:MAG: F0F1 ATP synthase subunit A [Candidatus Margulisiibacteriota bacterium]|jgi:F-type H+-transporting ATPase subunit a
MESAHHALVPIDLFGINLDITLPIVIMWGAMLAVFILLFLATRIKMLRLIEEMLYEFFAEQLNQLLVTKNKIWFTFIISLFLFVLFNNLAGLIPGSEAPTSNINVTAALAILVFLVSQVMGLYFHGLKHFKNILIPPGIPKVLIVVMVPIEFMSQLTRPFSLALRLFANMFAGHTVLLVFLGFTIALAPFLKPLPFVGSVILSMFEIFVSVIQAFIFAYLAAFYISDTVKGSH